MPGTDHASSTGLPRETVLIYPNTSRGLGMLHITPGRTSRWGRFSPASLTCGLSGSASGGAP